MKILDFGRRILKLSADTLERRIFKCSNKRTYLPPEIQIREQPISDTFNGRINLKFLEEGPYINEGRSAVVYGIKNHPDLVVRVRFGKKFKPENLSFKNSDPVRHIIAGTDDFQVTIMEKMKGEPLHGEYWHIMDRPTGNIYFPQLNALKDVPDEAFIKYHDEILKIREQGYNVDTTNPNNILFDAEKQEFNLVDIEKNPVKREVVVDDFYPFIDGARLRAYYIAANDETKALIQKEAKIFLDRIAKIGERIGTDLTMRKIEDDAIIPPFLNCLYYNHPKLRLYRH